MVTATTRSAGALLIAALLPAGIAWTDLTKPEASADESAFAVIYVYHQSDSTWAKSAGAITGRRVVILLDGSKVLSLRHGRHVRLLVQPGAHTVSAKTKILGVFGISTIDRSIDAQAGKNYYLHFFERNIGGGSVFPAFVVEDEAAGSKAVASTDAAVAKQP